MKKFDFIEPVSFTDLAINNVHHYLKNKSLTDHHAVIKAFEDSLSKYLNVKYCICVNSGTTGLIMAIKALGLKKEVIVPSFTFSSTVHALTWNGITPRFTDIDQAGFNLDLNKIRKNINSKTSAILAVHMFGNPSHITSLEALAKEHKLKLIFDSAHGFGCEYNGRMLGSFGDLEVFSLQTSKILPVLEGGFITTNQEALYKILLLLRSQGNQGDGNCLYVGLNGKMHPLAAVLGQAALKNIDKNIRSRRKMGKYYRSLLSQTPGITLQEINEQALYNYQYMPLVINKDIFGLSRDKLMQQLSDKGISTRKYFHPPIHQFSCYGKAKKKSSLKVTEYISKNILCLPFQSTMTFKDIEYICRTIHQIRAA